MNKRSKRLQKTEKVHDHRFIFMAKENNLTTSNQDENTPREAEDKSMEKERNMVRSRPHYMSNMKPIKQHGHTWLPGEAGHQCLMVV